MFMSKKYNMSLVKRMTEYSTEEARKSGLSNKDWMWGFVYKNFIANLMVGIEKKHPVLILKASRYSALKVDDIILDIEEKGIVVDNRYELEYPFYLSELERIIPEGYLKEDLREVVLQIKKSK